MRDPTQIRAQVLIVLLGAPALWLASTLTTPSRWLYVGIVAAVLVVCEVLVLRFMPFQSRSDHRVPINKPVMAGVYYILVAGLVGGVALVATGESPPHWLAKGLLGPNRPWALEATTAAAAATFLLGVYILIRRRFSKIEGVIAGLIAIGSLWFGVPFLLLLLVPIFLLRPHEERARDA